VIEASYGLGESVVAGLVVPDFYRLARDGKLLEAPIAAKDVMVRIADCGGTDAPRGGVRSCRKLAHDADELKIEDSETAETARRDLDRIFNTGGVAALVRNTYGAARDVGVYVTGEAIRGLADLEAKERERCGNFASKAVAAGLAERTVRIAERQGQLMSR
jgi:hypothetical protein